MKKKLLLTYLFISINLYSNIILTPPPVASSQSLCYGATVAELNAVGTNLLWYQNATDNISLTSETILASGIYFVSQTINNEESEKILVEVTINQAPLIDELEDVYSCAAFTLPTLAVGAYYGDENLSELFYAGDEIESSRTMYVYGENECGTALSSFYITIESAPILPLQEIVEVCNSYFLPDFYEGGYHTETGGNGGVYSGGDEITMSQTLYKYITNSCGSAETVIEIIINPEPYVDFLDDVYTCESYELPNISSGNFYTQPHTGGDILYAGDLITSSQTIYLYAGNGCGEAQSSFYVDIYDLDNTISLNENTLTAGQTDASYEWWDCNTETFILGANEQSFTPTDAGIYSVFISYGGCSVWSDCALSHPLTIKDQKLEQFFFYPNPASSKITIVNEQLSKINKIEVFDLSGKIVLQQKNDNNIVNIENLASGMYMIQIYLEDEILTSKLIKQ